MKCPNCAAPRLDGCYCEYCGDGKMSQKMEKSIPFNKTDAYRRLMQMRYDRMGLNHIPLTFIPKKTQ